MEFLDVKIFFTAVTVLVILGMLFGALLGFASKYLQVEQDPVVDQIDQLLPQTQCGQCGFPGCKPYAQSIAEGDAINKCPPGGKPPSMPSPNYWILQQSHWMKNTERNPSEPSLSFARTSALAVPNAPACPVDAIVGAAKLMHTVIADECTGCDLCVVPCPVDCIDMIPLTEQLSDWYWPAPIQAETIPSAPVAARGQT